jgi:hypothetical protein
MVTCNVSIDIAAVAYYHISDPEKAVIVIENVYDDQSDQPDYCARRYRGISGSPDPILVSTRPTASHEDCAANAALSGRRSTYAHPLLRKPAAIPLMQR